MAVTGKTIPSINVPFTDKNGRINPIWHEFLRSFVAASVDGTIVEGGIPTNIVAGNGLVGTTEGNTTSLRVGQGQGIAVNADDVNLDINSLQSVELSLEDEIPVSDISDNNIIKKTAVRNLVATPGGNNTHVQYNDNGVFAANSGFTYNGVDTVKIGTTTYSNSTWTTDTNADKMLFQVPAGSSTTHFTFRQSGAGSSDMPARFGSSLSSTDLIIDNDLDAGGSTLSESRLKFCRQGVTKWAMGLEGSSGGGKFIMAVSQFNSGVVYNIDPTNNFFNMVTSLTRSTTAGITASTTQTQGQQALTTDINEISVCANINDVVTLPVALAGRSCLVINNGVQLLQIFPASGDDLGAGVNTSTTLLAGSRKLFVAIDSTNWEPII